MPGPQVCVGGCLRCLPGMAVGGKVSRGVGDAAPYGLPGMGGDGSLPLIRPCGATFPWGEGRAVIPPGGVGGRFRGASGTPPLRFLPGMGGSGSLPLIRPLRGHLPPRGKAKLLLAAVEGRGGVGAPALRMGIWKRPRGLRGHRSGRRA